MLKKTKINKDTSLTIKDIIKSAVLGALIAFLITRLILPTTIIGDSMYPGLKDTDIVLIDVFNKTFENNDIIIFRYDEEDIIKRIIASENDLITIKDSNLYLNNILIKEPYILEKQTSGTCNLIVPKGFFYVLGDNRQASCDSRCFGLVDINSIKGKMICKFTYLNKLKNYKTF